MRSSFISLVLSSARSPANNLAPLLTFNLPLFPAVSLIFYFLLTALFAHLCRLSTASPFPLSPCHVLPFNRLRKWAEVTASLQYNRAVNCSDYILWELYLLLSLNEDWPDTYLSLYAWKCRMPERFRYIFWIQSPLLSFPYHLFLAPPPPISSTENKFKCKQGKSAWLVLPQERHFKKKAADHCSPSGKMLSDMDGKFIKSFFDLTLFIAMIILAILWQRRLYLSYYLHMQSWTREQPH